MHDQVVCATVRDGRQNICRGCAQFVRTKAYVPMHGLEAVIVHVAQEITPLARDYDWRPESELLETAPVMLKEFTELYDIPE